MGGSSPIPVLDAAVGGPAGAVRTVAPAGGGARCRDCPVASNRISSRCLAFNTNVSAQSPHRWQPRRMVYTTGCRAFL